MGWEKIVLLSWMAFEALGAVARIGKPRKPFTPTEALGTLILLGGAAALVVLA